MRPSQSFSIRTVIPGPHQRFGAAGIPPQLPRDWEQKIWIPRRRPSRPSVVIKPLVAVEPKVEAVAPLPAPLPFVPPPEPSWEDALYGPQKAQDALRVEVQAPRPAPVLLPHIKLETVNKAARVYQKSRLKIPASGARRSASAGGSPAARITSSWRNPVLHPKAGARREPELKALDLKRLGDVGFAREVDKVLDFFKTSRLLNWIQNISHLLRVLRPSLAKGIKDPHRVRVVAYVVERIHGEMLALQGADGKGVSSQVLRKRVVGILRKLTERAKEDADRGEQVEPGREVGAFAVSRGNHNGESIYFVRRREGSKVQRIHFILTEEQFRLWQGGENFGIITPDPV